jgi:hypothetical protein
MHPAHNKSYIDKLQIEIDILDCILNEIFVGGRLTSGILCVRCRADGSEVKAGHHRTISLSLCNICVNKFGGDD